MLWALGRNYKLVFRHIKDTLDFGLKFVVSDKGKNLSLQGSADANWAADVSTRKSTSGYVFRLGGATIEIEASTHGHFIFHRS